MNLLTQLPQTTEVSATSPAVDVEAIACPGCEGRRHAPLIVSRDADSNGREWQIVRCLDCELAFTNPRPTRAAIGAYYPSDYQCYEPSRAWDTRWKARLRRRLEMAVLRADFGHGPQPVSAWTRLLARGARLWIRRGNQRAAWLPFVGRGRLLDFGCGAGAFLRTMQSRGWQVQGMDFSEHAAAALTRETGIRVWLGSLPHPEIAPHSFDAITLWHSLEHVYEPRQVLSAANSLLAPGGLLLVAVPNLASWGFERFTADWFPLDLPRHLTHFTPRTLAAMMTNCGYEVTDVRHVTTDGWLRSSAKKALQAGNAQAPLALVRKSQALKTARWTERCELGDSIVVTARKAA